MLKFTHDQLRAISFEIFKVAGATDEEARIVSDLLVESNLAGHDSHGVLRIPQYVRMILNGDIKPGANIEIVRETPSTAVINGNWGFGQLIATKAMRIAIETNPIAVAIPTKNAPFVLDITTSAAAGGKIRVELGRIK